MDIEGEFAKARDANGVEAAVAMVEGRAGQGDPAALHLVGHWLLWGQHGRQDLTQGYAHVLAAAQRGDVPAMLTLATLVASGTGLPRDGDKAAQIVRGLATRSPEAARQVRVADTAPAAIAPREILREDPLVARIDGLLSAEECAYLIAKAEPKLQPSMIYNDGQQVPNPVRDSHGAGFAPTEEDLVIHGINRRIAEATGTRWEQGEPLHILRYEPGQQYRPHFDGLPGAHNQRVLTCLVYLNEGFEGGETAFADEFTVKGRTGDAVIFANTTPDGRIDRRTQHAGLPVTDGVKFLATRWIRGGRYHPWEPETMR